MPSKGLVSNKIAGGWDYYPIDLLCAGSGGETQPFLDRAQFSTGNPTQYGRFQQDLDTGWVNAQVQIEFVNTSTTGAGGAYVIRLPRPVRRLFPKLADATPIGKAMCYKTFVPAPNQNMNCIVTAANPYPSLMGDEDNWCQIYAPEIVQRDTGVISGATSLVVNHAVGYAFDAADISFMPSDNDLASTSPFMWVGTITSTQFTANVRGATAPSGDGLGFGWHIRGRSTMPTGSAGAVVSPTVPWVWGSPHVIFLKLGYEGVLP